MKFGIHKKLRCGTKMGIEEKLPTPDEIFDVRDEAMHRHPNYDFNERLNSLYEVYLDYNNNKELQKQIEQEVKNTFETMVFLGYSPGCVGLYQNVWEHTQTNEHGE